MVARNMKPIADIGTCQLAPPTVLRCQSLDAAMWPQTHASRFCGGWERRTELGGGGGPDDGERVGGEVVAIRSVAA